MAEGPEEHLEHAEHAAHAAHNPFDRMVTVSIAIVAAVLAAVTMMGHRAHNATLQYQGEALGHQTMAGIYQAKASNKWALYQAQNVRQHMYEAMAEQTAVIASTPGKEVEQKGLVDTWKTKAASYQQKMDKWKEEAEKLEEQSAEEQKEQKESQEKSHDIHHRTDSFDYGELGLQLGVVLCSLAILTKRKPFWFAGLICAVAGLVMALTGVLS